ncbi:hypothetical protein BH11BAC2_BH11BAC2_03010 [soil metagenome]
MSKFIIERNIPSVGSLNAFEMQAAAHKSNVAIKNLSQPVQWIQSYVTNDKLYCVYLADSKDAVQEHADKSGFPANRIEVVKTIIDPTTGE